MSTGHTQPSLCSAVERCGTQSQEQQLRRTVKWFRGGLVFQAHRLLYHSTLGSRVMEIKTIAKPGPEYGPGFSTFKAKAVNISKSFPFRPEAVLPNPPPASRSERPRDAVCVYVVRWSNSPVVPAYRHICSAVVRVPHRRLLPSLPTPWEISPLPPATPQSYHMLHIQTSDSTRQTSQKGLAVKVNPRSEIGRFGLNVRIGATGVPRS